MKRVAVLGSTGFIGRQTLDVVDASNGELTVGALTAHKNVDLFLEQVHKYRPKIAGMTDLAAAEQARPHMPDDCTFIAGEEVLRVAAGSEDVDIALAAIVGIAGLPSVMAAIEAGHDVALANKEALVTGGALVTDAAKRMGCELLPVDSEHSAIFQCLQNDANKAGLSRILLTCSGGPFRT